MSQYTEASTKAFEAAGALTQYTRVTLNTSTGKLLVAGATDTAIGVTERPAFADGDFIAVRLTTAQGTCKVVANAAITKGDPVYAAADGEIAPSGAVMFGYAIEAATADGDIIEVLPAQSLGSDANSAGTVAATGSTQGDAAAITTRVTAVTAGDDTKGVVLPTAIPGDQRVILNSGSAGLKIYPATADKINNGSANAAITILENTTAILNATAVDNWAAVFTVNS